MTEEPPLKFPVHIPFVQQLGFELVRIDEGEAELRVDIRELHLNSWEVAHGGVLMTLLDVAMAHAARSVHRDQPGFGPGVVTVEMKTSFMRPGEGALRAVGWLLHRSTTTAFCGSFAARISATSSAAAGRRTPSAASPASLMNSLEATPCDW